MPSQAMVRLELRGHQHLDRLRSDLTDQYDRMLSMPREEQYEWRLSSPCLQSVGPAVRWAPILHTNQPKGQQAEMPLRSPYYGLEKVRYPPQLWFELGAREYREIRDRYFGNRSATNPRSATIAYAAMGIRLADNVYPDCLEPQHWSLDSFSIKEAKTCITAFLLQLHSVFLASAAFAERALLGVLLPATVGTCEHELNAEGGTLHATEEFDS